MFPFCDNYPGGPHVAAASRIIITKRKHFRWWNVFECRMGRWSFWSLFNV